MLNEDIENIIPKIKYQIERCNIKLGVQYYKVVKIGCVLFLSLKVDLKEQMELLKEILKEILKEDIELALIVSKINNRTIFKEKGELQARSRIKFLKKENIGVYMEIIKKQQV